MTILHQLGDVVRESLAAIPPGVVRILFVALPLSLLFWVWTLPKAETKPPAAETRGGMDLRWGVTLALGVQILIYALL
jgi:hypothetical protein